ncbi:Retinitis pigmentosa 1-like 1 protein [Bagarius yarrelli]|uniref:Retinitis pigmentosa 1-like 1 protein n=1 Tax=Bagarius yarrelli TaxID=175774 RepID=A0A556U927_BAGYA|nr:Retinitis pigmentosa 1-like 1 protein [Bagarius yarrelli]
MQSSGFSNACSQIRNDSLSHFSSVTTPTPAKRITFYKSGDNQFSGLRMPIHKRSFRCFDALLDDLSQKIPLPFGVRTITTPRGTHAIQSLEQLQDGACYVCSDRQYVKPIDMEVAGKQAAVWHHNYPLNTPRKPSRPDKLPARHSSHHYHRHPKRILLIKNSDPALRRSIVLSKKRTHSLHVFMEEISELMEYNVRKLYTLDGRKIDSMQSLMQCPSVLVCVGREPFNPLLLEHLRKNSEEKLPGIGVRPHSSIYSEGHDSKKNVNFKLETKKSIIHPRSDSSNKSTRFSLSSEKSHPNESGLTSGQLGCVTKEVVINDDVEKRVLVNKDGSLSVEMKVRFRLVSDETLQWSTKIKKLPTSTNECNSLQEEEPQCLHGTAVHSEPETNAECETEEGSSPKCHQMDFIESYCQNCCNHNQGYDIWKNPLHKEDGTRSSSHSPGSSDKIMHQKASVNRVYTVSRSSEEYLEHVVEKASSFQQTIQEGDTRLEYCSISRCCSRSEASTGTKNRNEPTDSCESNTGIMCYHNNHRKTDYAKIEHLSEVTQLAENLISATSNSSNIQSFKKDEKDDYDDLSPSVSRASQWCSEQNKPFKCLHCHSCQRLQHLHSSSVPPKVFSCSADTLKSKLYKSLYAAPEESIEGHSDSTDSPRPSLSKVSSRSQCCCSQCRDTTSLMESKIKSDLKESHHYAMFDDDSKMSNNSRHTQIKSENRSTSAMLINTCFSVMSTECPCCGGCGRLTSTIPTKFGHTPVKVAEEDGKIKPLPPEQSNKCAHCAQEEDPAGDPVQNRVQVNHACSQCALYNSKKSKKSNQHAYGTSCDAEMISKNNAYFGGGTKSTISGKSIESSNNDTPDNLTTSRQENQTSAQENIRATENVMQDFDTDTKERVPTSESTKTNPSNDSDQANKSKSNNIQDILTVSSPVSTSITDTCHEKKPLEKSSVLPCKNAKASVNLNACFDGEVESELNHTDMNKGQNTRQTTDDAKYSAQSSFSMASSTPESPVTAENNNQTLSVKSVNSKVSSKSTSSNKDHCSSFRCIPKVAHTSTGVGKPSASNGLLNEPLSPTSTASVSLGLGAEEQSEDLNEQIFDKPKCLPEEYTSEPSSLEHMLNLAMTRTPKRDKTAVSTCSAVTDKTQLCNVMEDTCKVPEVTSGTLTESITKPNIECKVEVQLLQNGDHRVPSTLSGSSGKSQKTSPSKNTSRIEINTNTDNGENNRTLSISGCSLQSIRNKRKSVASTTTGAATSKNQYTTKSKKNSFTKLEMKKVKKNSATSAISVKASKSDTKPSPRNKYANKSQVSRITPDSKGNSVLPHPPDLLGENNTDAKPDSRRSSLNTSDRNNVRKENQHIDKNFKNKKNSPTFQYKTEDHDKKALMPSCLPNASATDVVNDWLKNIPIDGTMYVMEDDFHEQHDTTLSHIPAVGEEECLQNRIRDHSKMPLPMVESEEIIGPKVADPVTKDENRICEAKLVSDETFQIIAANSDVSSKFIKRESLSNNCQSSIQVMKALLSPKLDRCNSLPEVSPTYGRKLSTSVKGLIDCLANLQMIDPDPKIYDKYAKIISTLQALWMNRSSETVQDQHNRKNNLAEDENNLRSSSGVDLSSGSLGSCKRSISGGLEKSEIAQGNTLIAEEKALSQNQGDGITGGESESSTPENINPSLVSSFPITPDIAERVRCSPEHEKLNKEALVDEGLKGTGDDAIQTNGHIKDIKEIDIPLSKRASENNRNVKTAVNKSIPAENYSSKTSTLSKKGELTKHISQDPDPVWVLGLLRKLEKQFMSHYANAIAEFKVRWDLTDNETLDIMISELKEEVHRRIQSTINRELQKIQSRAGKTPKPPISMLSRDSTARTEQRRRRLKGMQNKFINPSTSEDVNTASGTEFSDQRSEDEYCPCDKCVKQKMESRVGQYAEALKVAPVLKEFDLRKILQTKKDPPVTMPVQAKLHEHKDQLDDANSSSVQDKDNLDKQETNDAKEDSIIEHGKDGSWEEKKNDNNIKDADNVESLTEKEKHEVEEDLEDTLTERKEANEVYKTADEELAKENELPD